MWSRDHLHPIICALVAYAETPCASNFVCAHRELRRALLLALKQLKWWILSSAYSFSKLKRIIQPTGSRSVWKGVEVFARCYLAKRIDKKRHWLSNALNWTQNVSLFLSGYAFDRWVGVDRTCFLRVCFKHIVVMNSINKREQERYWPRCSGLLD